jgi:hypothetical protein
MQIADGKIRLRTSDDHDPEKLAKTLADMKDWLNSYVAGKAYEIFGIAPSFYFDDSEFKSRLTE